MYITFQYLDIQPVAEAKGGFPLDEFVRANRIFSSRRIPILISTCEEKPR